MHPSKHVGEW